MAVLTLYAFLGGIVIILSPCILPILPLILQGSASTGKRKPLGIITGFVVSFTFFTLFLSAVVSLLRISPDVMRYIAAGILGLMAIILIIPALTLRFEMLASNLSSKGTVKTENKGFVGGLIVGLSLGLVWTPCVGPIMASVITLAMTSAITLQAVVITFAFTMGTAIPMFFIMYGGKKLFERKGFLKKNAGTIQKIFAGLMLLTAVAIALNLDRRFQGLILRIFPNYGTALTAVEDNKRVEEALKLLD